MSVIELEAQIGLDRPTVVGRPLLRETSTTINFTVLDEARNAFDLGTSYILFEAKSIHDDVVLFSAICTITPPSADGKCITTLTTTNLDDVAECRGELNIRSGGIGTDITDRVIFRFEIEDVINPALTPAISAIPDYANLKEYSRYLHEIVVDAGRELRPDEIKKCNGWASTHTIGKFGKIWKDPNVPEQIKEIADLYASSKAWKTLHTGQTPKESDYSKVLKKEADELVKEIMDGDVGIVLPDGTFDPDFPGPSDEVDDQEETSVEIIC